MGTTPSHKDADPAEEANMLSGDGGIYLVVADETAEFELAMKYAAHMAAQNKGHVAVLYALPDQDFQHWGNIQERMRREQREKAERFLWDVAGKLNAFNDTKPSFLLEEGSIQDALVRIIDRDLNIRVLVLGAGTESSGPGPLVSYFTTKGLTRLRIPMLLVPDHVRVQK
ncbi:MAG: universal stress protein [Alphaproteobacteria bacterium]|nr:universal stress protein [Alphaproteobacteria bacterium]